MPYESFRNNALDLIILDDVNRDAVELCCSLCLALKNSEPLLLAVAQEVMLGISMILI